MRAAFGRPALFCTGARLSGRRRMRPLGLKPRTRFCSDAALERRSSTMSPAVVAHEVSVREVLPATVAYQGFGTRRFSRHRIRPCWIQRAPVLSASDPFASDLAATVVFVLGPSVSVLAARFCLRRFCLRQFCARRFCSHGRMHKCIGVLSHKSTLEVGNSVPLGESCVARARLSRGRTGRCKCRPRPSRYRPKDWPKAGASRATGWSRPRRESEHCLWRICR